MLCSYVRSARKYDIMGLPPSPDHANAGGLSFDDEGNDDEGNDDGVNDDGVNDDGVNDDGVNDEEVRRVCQRRW
jgi:hypothetical protein